MSPDDSALVACVVLTGLWSGALAMLTLAMHRMTAAMNSRDVARLLRAFLPPTRHAAFNYAMVIGMAVSPIVALFARASPPALRSYSRRPASA